LLTDVSERLYRTKYTKRAGDARNFLAIHAT
jgi:hypothetical protein